MAEGIRVNEAGAQVLERAAERSWTRWVTPSFADLLFLCILVWLFLSAPNGWERLLYDTDTALHTRIGQEILSTGSIPHQDPFSFTRPNQPWLAYEWLAGTAFAFLHNLAGLKGVVLLCGVLIAGYLTLLFRYSLWSGSSGMAALALTLIVSNATAIHYHARPHLFTLVLLTAAIWLLTDYRRNGGQRVWLLAPLTVLWANLHGGFAIFFALLALRITGCLAEALLWPEIRVERRREAVRLAFVSAACAAASLVNPYGIHLHRHIAGYLNSKWMLAQVSEFQSPSFRSEGMYQVMLVLFAGLALVTPLLRKRRVVEALWILFLAYAALSAVRHTTIFLLVAAPIVAVELSDWWKELAARRPPQSVVRILDDISRQLAQGAGRNGPFVPAVVIFLAFAPGMTWPRAFPEVNTPVKFLEKHKDRLASARLYTSDQNAGYLLFLNSPRQRVFMDSRHNFYGEGMVRDYIAIGNGMPQWRSLLDSYGLDAVLCPRESPLASLLGLSAGWRRVDGDGTTVLYERLPAGT